MSAIRGTFGLLTFVLAGLVAGGCELPAPELPSAPELPEEAEQVKPKGGNCCIRIGKALQSKCNGKPCCAPKLDADQCEAVRGFWFHSTEGCAGAC